MVEKEDATWYTKSISVSMRCRKLTSESFIFTFVDHDGTVSKAAAIAPIIT